MCDRYLITFSTAAGDGGVGLSRFGAGREENDERGRLNDERNTDRDEMRDERDDEMKADEMRDESNNNNNNNNDNNNFACTHSTRGSTGRHTSQS